MFIILSMETESINHAIPWQCFVCTIQALIYTSSPHIYIYIPQDLNVLHSSTGYKPWELFNYHIIIIAILSVCLSVSPNGRLN